MLSYAARSDAGCHRDNNEDHFVCCPAMNLWVLADGVGGRDAGEVASEVACRVISQELRAGASLEDAIHLAHDSLLDAPREGVGIPGMASTVVALLVHGDSYQVSWVGDSRCYRWRPGRGMEQISHDHSLVQRLIDERHITEEQAADHPGRHVVLQALGQENLPLLHVDSIRDSFADGDVILLCSDGLSDYVEENDIAAAFDDGDDLEIVAERLVEKTLANDGADNVTVVLVRLEARAVEDTEVQGAAAPGQALPANAKSDHWLPAIAVAALVLVALVFYLV